MVLPALLLWAELPSSSQTGLHLGTEVHPAGEYPFFYNLLIAAQLM